MYVPTWLAAGGPGAGGMATDVPGTPLPAEHAQRANASGAATERYRIALVVGIAGRGQMHEVARRKLRLDRLERRGRLRKIEAIRKVVGAFVRGVERGKAEDLLRELQDATELVLGV